MEMTAKQREFILLRADGLSFDKLATKLKASKSVLIQWSKLFEEQIKEIQFEAFVRIKELHSFNTQQRYNTLLEQLTIIDDGIKGSDLTKSTVKDLFTIKNDILMQLDRIEAKIKTDPKIEVKNEFGMTEKLEFKLNEI
jgi:transposase